MRHLLTLTVLALIGGASIDAKGPFYIEEPPIPPAPTFPDAPTFTVYNCPTKACEQSDCSSATYNLGECLPLGTSGKRSVLVQCGGGNITFQNFAAQYCVGSNNTHGFPVDSCLMEADHSYSKYTCHGGGSHSGSGSHNHSGSGSHHSGSGSHGHSGSGSHGHSGSGGSHGHSGSGHGGSGSHNSGSGHPPEEQAQRWFGAKMDLLFARRN